METSSVDIDKLLSKNFFLWIQCPKISLLLFKDGADLRMESFSCKFFLRSAPSIHFVKLPHKFMGMVATSPAVYEKKKVMQ